MLTKDRMRFFSHDVDMRNDLKVRGLRRHFGNDGYAVWCYLLEVITDTEDLCINIAVMLELLAADFDVAPELLSDIVAYCVKVGLLQRNGDILFSTRHRERIMGVIDNAREKSERGRKAVMARWRKGEEHTNTAECESNTPVLPMNTNKKREEETRQDETREEKKRVTQYPCDEVMRLWNELCISLPKVMRLSDNRREKVKARLREWGGDDTANMVQGARELFVRIEASDFLTGRSGKWKGASFDWIFDSRNNWIKVMEGNYDNERGGASRASISTNTLGVGEFINQQGKRTYGSGKTIIPDDAPARPSERHQWNASNNQWILL